MLDTSARLLRLLSLLQTREWTGRELGERLGVSPRTVRNDVDKLRELGYPVLATRGPAGGYRLGAGAAVPPLLLDDEEAVAVAVGPRTVATGAIAGIEEASLRTLAKLEQVLPSRLRARVGGLQSVITPVPYASAGPVVDPDVLTAVAAACRARERLRFSYQSREGAVSERMGPYAGTVTPVSSESCALDTGSDSLAMMAVYLGFMGWDFRVESPRELADEVRALAERYQRALPGRSGQPG
jgi:predicted DNA-binding transcriptional regulator YafY